MATGDSSDFQNRIKGLLPPSWFSGDNLTVLSSLLAGVSAPFTWIYNLYLYTLSQMRIATATGVWVDRISYDYLGNRLPRLVNELDDPYRQRVKKEIMRPRQTRDAVRQALYDLTGRYPIIIELFNPLDCGSWDGPAFGWDTAGCWGELTANNQLFVTAYRPAGEGVPNVGGWDTGAGGYDIGATEFIDMAWVSAQVTDDDIYAAVAGITAAGMTAWTAILS